MIMLKHLEFLLVFFLLTVNGFGQKVFQNPSDELTSRGEVYFRFKNTSQIDREKISKTISVDHATNREWVYAYANKKELDEFLNLNISYEILPHPGSLINPLMKDHLNPSGTLEWDFYPTYEAYVELMFQFEQLYPGLCKTISIGNTVQSRQLLCAKITANANMQEDEPRFLYTSSMHGDETTGYVLMLRLIDYLIKNYGNDPLVTSLLDNTEIWINPLANPDGTYAGGNESVCCATRYNANNIDLNRNYPDPEDGQHPDGNAWQPETEAFMALADSLSFIMSANFHGGAEVFNYPWDTWPQLHADDDWWQYVGREWADTVHAYSPAGYFDDLNDGITNGYAWYTLAGGRQDFMNYFHQCREVTVEISVVKLLPGSELPDFWNYNFHSFLNYIDQSRYGLTGIVTDSASGNPLQAVVEILNHDNNNSWITTSNAGHYFRVLYEGIYDIKFSAPGHKSKTVEMINIFNRQSTQLNIQLAEGSDGINEMELLTLFTLSPNPAKDFIHFNYLGNQSIECEIELSDAEGNIINSWIQIVETDNSPIIINIRNLKPGLYFFRLRSGSTYYTNKVIVR